VLPSYAIVSPVRDEAAFLRRTAASLLSQRHRPLEWIVVDDGSSDGTVEIARDLAAEHDWIHVRETGADGPRSRGGRIVRAFGIGLQALRVQPDVVVKLDGDLHLPDHYFQWLCAVFERDAHAGIVGGQALVHDESGWRPDRRAGHTIPGLAKAYRMTCLEDIGGLHPSMGWDGIDEYAARARGWHVHALPELTILHYRQRGTAQSWRKARFEEGIANHYMGYLPTFVAVRVAYRSIVAYPPLLGGLTLGAGYLWSRLRRRPRADDAQAIAELRREQRARLRRLVGRGATTVKRQALPGGGPAFWDLDPERPPTGRFARDGTSAPAGRR
jgi:glycosyltransferase involved in cell wall biosynthesis